MPRFIVISNSNELVRITPDRLVCITADGNYSTLVLTGGKKHIFSINIGEIQRTVELQLKEESQQFIRLGKSLIINNNYIYSINLGKQTLTLADSQFQHHYELQASREALKQLKTVIESNSKTDEDEK